MFFILSFNLHAQDPVPFQPGSWIKANNVVPPSPQAASLGSYGNVPVNYYTGSPSINIPLYGIGGKYLSAPISLSYDPQSVRVATIPSWTGLGWTLQAGGVITRSVKGRPDLGENYYQFETLKPQFAGMIEAGSSNLILENDFYYQVAGGHIESQPDVYYFNFPVYLGSFVILKNKTLSV